ncbi:MAG: valine--tRNA ligase [Oscillospiraceae bacterium]|nr:valine--tRNA ligase [Oscillospiraceae bacterium]
MKRELPKLYDPKTVEEKIYKYWLDNDCFKAVVDRSKKPYTIVIPPPNITGQLHMGHALNNTLQDILIRWKRMSGFATLWLPGTDHASIATEARIVAAMRAEGITKDDIGREGFLKRAWDWKEQCGGTIVSQLKKLGSSCDWSRERFTMDEGCNKAVREVFVKYYEKGLIYRAERIINWCPVCLTSISDAEVNHEEKAGHFWHIRYPLTDGSGSLELATTRPETLLGDTAVAVNPKDERYKKYIGKTVTLPLVGREIPVVADDYVDMEFGTGVVKITPAHDPNDFEVGLRHNLPIVNAMTDDAKITDDYPKYVGLDRYDARKAIVKDLEDGGFLIKTQEHTHNVGACYRCSVTIEPRVSKQWFVKMEQLAKPAAQAVKSGKMKFVPERFEKLYHHWLDNIRDWCISRQLWWGHRIPAFYCDDCGEIVVTAEESAVCACGADMRQDPDTLDTWFSSALWPFSTLGFPEKTDDLDFFYPTNTLVTSYDIIFFWVIRMMFSGIEFMGEVPFDTVLINGLVRDPLGRKMSKSLDNGIDPLDEIDKYGADALRFMLVSGNAPGNDMRYIEDKTKAARGFANKLWNASRFIMMNLPDDFEFTGLAGKQLRIEDKWLLSKFNTLADEVNYNLDKFELGVAAGKVYDFIWDIYCDWYIEITKPRIAAGGEDCNTAQNILVLVMSNMLKLLHPFMPFITEEIYESLGSRVKGAGMGLPLMLSEYPKFDKVIEEYKAEEAQFEKLIAAIRAVRARRAEMNVPPSVKAKLLIETPFQDVFGAGVMFLERLAYASSVEIAEKFEEGDAVTIVTDSARIFIPLDELIDKEKEIARLNKEKEAALKDVAFSEGKLNNQGFRAKAPASQIEAETEKLSKARERLAKIEQSILVIGKN